MSLLPRLKSHLNLSDNPGRSVEGHDAGENDEGLAQNAHQRRIVRDDEIAVPELVHKVSGSDADTSASNSVKVGLGDTD